VDLVCFSFVAADGALGAVIIRRSQALSGIIGRKELVGGLLRLL
jgi:hypothetical protein